MKNKTKLWRRNAVKANRSAGAKHQGRKWKYLSYIEYYKNDNYFEMNKTYKERYSFEERCTKVKSFQESDPDKIMVIVEKHARSKLPDLQNSKYVFRL